MEQGKVYCGDCANSRRVEWGETECEATRREDPSYWSRCTKRDQCKVINYNNLCPDYRPSMWKRFKDRLFGRNQPVKETEHAENGVR